MLGGSLLMEYLAVVEYCFADQPGGAARVAWDIAKTMRQRGHSVTLLCYRASDETREGVELVDGMRVVRFQKRKQPGWHPARLQAIMDATATACRTWLGDRRFEVVHVHSPIQGLGVLAALGTEPRYVFTAHSPLVLEQEITWRSQGWTGRLKLLLGRGLLANAERRMLGASAAIHTLSEFTRSELERAYRVGRRVSVIPHWYTPRGPRLGKLEARRALGWPQDAKIFFTVRVMGPRYGLDVAIRALGPLTQESDCHFYLGGDGPLRPQLEALAACFRRAGGADECIHFMGRISDEQLETAYAAADLFILPTLALECFGLIMIEAMTFGCPVLGTDAAAIPELLGPILPEFIVPAGDVAALQSRARQFLQANLPVPDRQMLIDYASSRYGEATVAPELLRLFEPSA
jgi:glycosyltransferase involved in cell wall biosynthesis